MPETSSMISHALKYLSCWLLSLGLTCYGAVPVSRALVIGLGQQEDSSWGKINGDNDVMYVVNMLQRHNYTDIQTLRNEQATKQAIVDALAALADRCDANDRVYIHYSGHGQLITDLDGDEASRWNGWHSQWDESLIPYDAYMTYGPNDYGEHHMTDDELARLLTAIRKQVGRKGEIIVVIDACHSGDATCGELNETVRGIDTKFNIPKDANAPMSDPVAEQWLTISACQPYQLCTEIKGKRVGKLTFALYSMGSTFFDLSNRDMERLLAQFIEKYEGRLPQTPMVTGRKHL